MDDTNDILRTVYVDMDGVIADFDLGFEKLTGFTTNSVSDEQLWKLISDNGKFKFFSDLPWTSGGKELWLYVSQNFIKVKILTALGRSDVIDGGLASKGKRMWLHKNIPELKDSDIIMVANKHKKRHYSKPGDIIIDDRESTISEWNKKGGIGILYKSTPQTIEQLKKYV